MCLRVAISLPPNSQIAIHSRRWGKKKKKSQKFEDELAKDENQIGELKGRDSRESDRLPKTDWIVSVLFYLCVACLLWLSMYADLFQIYKFFSSASSVLFLRSWL